jgi:uncharacterized protein with HEPN domain
MQSGIKNDLVYLLRILESIGKIQLYIADFEEAIGFFRANDQQNFNASLMLLINIGEQSNRVSDALKVKHSNLAWSQIKGFRNRIAHDYIGIDRFITFDILQNELPALKRQLEQIVRLEMLDGNFDREEYALAQTSEYYTHIDYKNID